MIKSMTYNWNFLLENNETVDQIINRLMNN